MKVGKRSINDLAVFSGQSTFEHPVHVGRPNVPNRESLLGRINGVLDRQWFTNNGPLVRELEQCIADHLDVEHCVVMCNGTTALEIAIRALGLEGEVIVPSFTFIATAHALRWLGIDPVFCDVGSQSHHIDPEKVRDLITPATTGIVGVHVWGKACDTTALQDIADQHGLKLIFDAAHAFACSHDSRMIGGFGDLEVFSFHATKFFSTFEGGAVTTHNSDLARNLRLMRNFGFAGYDSVQSIGTNGKMTEIAAAMGLTSFEGLQDTVDVNQRNYTRYAHSLKSVSGVTLFEYDPAERNNYQYVVVEVDEAATGISRDDLNRVLNAENVLSRRYFYPGCHRMGPYCSQPPNEGVVLENTDLLTKRVLSLPNGTAVSVGDIDLICSLVSFAVACGEEISQRLHAAS